MTYSSDSRNMQQQSAIARLESEGGPGLSAPQDGSNTRLIKANEEAQSPDHAILAITTFFVLTFAWSWLIGFIAIDTKQSAPVFSMVLTTASGFGPSIAAIFTVLFFSGRTGLMTWLKKSLSWRAGWRWYALAFLMPPLLMLLAQAIHWAMGGTIPTSPAVGHIPLAIANFGLVFLIGGPLGEEFGWRSYAVPALGSKMGWRTASLIIGVIWGLWHLPWFFTAGTAQSQMPFLVFMLNILAGAVLFSWLFLQSKGSVIPALVAHTSLNAWAGILSIVPSADTSRPYAVVTGLIAILAIWLLLRSDLKSDGGDLK
jgi:uncharacterized protein